VIILLRQPEGVDKWEFALCRCYRSFTCVVFPQSLSGINFLSDLGELNCVIVIDFLFTYSPSDTLPLHPESPPKVT
jgi:hypothetical protein